MLCKVKIAKLQPKNSNNYKNTAQQMTTENLKNVC